MWWHFHSIGVMRTPAGPGEANLTQLASSAAGEEGLTAVTAAFEGVDAWLVRRRL